MAMIDSAANLYLMSNLEHPSCSNRRYAPQTGVLLPMSVSPPSPILEFVHDCAEHVP